MNGYLRHSLLATLPMMLAVSCYARTLVVGANEAFRTPAGAVNAASAGDIILIKKGTYRVADLQITKKLVLKGEGYPVFDGQFKGDVVSVTADGTIVEGLDIRNTKTGSMKEFAGLKFSNCRNVKVSNCRFEGNFFAVYFSHVEKGLVSRNTIRGNNTEMNSGNGIHCWKSEEIRVEGNSISGHRDGIYIEFTGFSLITGNTCSNNFRYGLHFMFSSNDTYIGNKFISNGAGVAVMYSGMVEMRYNLFSNNRGSSSYGLLLKDINNSKVSNNRFEQNSTGIYLEGSSKLKIAGNDLVSNGWGIRIMADCTQDTFLLNNIIGNTFDMATNGTLNRNLFMQNYWDKYEGYDLNHDGTGDVPFRPVSLFSQVTENQPYAIMLYRSFLVGLLDRAEQAVPSLNGIGIMDESPSMRPVKR